MQYDTEVRITAVASVTGSADDTQKTIKLFSTVFPVPSGQFQISLDPVLGKTKALNDIMNKRGFLAGTTSGEVQLAEKTTSITLKTDYVFLNADKKGIEMSRNILDAMIKGEGFVHSNVYHKILGTNGTVKHGFNTRMNKLFGKLFELDGRLIIADAATKNGNSITTGNIRKTAYDKTCNYIILEAVSKFDDQTADGLRLVYTMNSDINWSDATDANEVSFTNTQLCDVRMVDKFFIEGWDSEAEVGVSVPARRVQLAKRPISMFKATAKLAPATGDVLGLTGATVTVNETFNVPGQVIVGDLAKGEFKEVEYAVGLNDMVALYVPGTTLLAGRNPMYAIGVATTARGDFAQAQDNTSANITVVSVSTATNEIEMTGVIDPVITVGALIKAYTPVTLAPKEFTGRVIGGANTDTLEVETIYGDLANVSTADSIYICTEEGEFTLVKSDYRIAEKDVAAGEYTINEETCAKATIYADDLNMAKIPILEFNFEESVFEELTPGGSCD